MGTGGAFEQIGRVSHGFGDALSRRHRRLGEQTRPPLPSAVKAYDVVKVTGAIHTSLPDTPQGIGVAAGRLRWMHDSDDLVAGRYRIRLAMPGLWETRYRGRTLRVDARRSQALAGAEHHHREVERIQQVVRWGLSSGIGLIGTVIASHWLATLVGFVLFAFGVCVFLGSLARCIAALDRSLLDPYRTRESWEPRDWWNRRE